MSHSNQFRSMSAHSPPKLNFRAHNKLEDRVYDIDYIGTGTFQVSQNDILQRRSLDLTKTTESQLSARGMQHRKREHFVKDVREATAVLGDGLSL
jgi:hypothetical protein